MKYQGSSKTEQGNWIIASNRLPFSWDEKSEKLTPSAGGLVTALSGVRSKRKMEWFGVASDKIPSSEIKRLSSKTKSTWRYHPIAVEDERYNNYYNGMCNEVLWPLLHYDGERSNFQDSYWKAYSEVNHQFAESILEQAKTGDLVWLHDFHLLLVPRILKRRRPDLKIGLFLHTPFPSSEVFRQLPVRRDILDSILKADLVGFHDYLYLRHFGETVTDILGLEVKGFSVERDLHVCKFGVFPVSIDTEALIKSSRSASVQARARDLENSQPVPMKILGVDRLDYIKGIDLKLKIFQQLLRNYPEMRGKVTFLQIAVPSRTDVGAHQQLRERIERLVGQINGEFGAPNYSPVQYLFKSIAYDELLALYQRADVLLVGSTRDGMNLVALEYLAAQDAKNPGVVVLSEFTGAISTLSHVLPINPWDISTSAEAVHRGLTMSKYQRVERHKPMLSYLKDYTSTTWADSFMQALVQNPENFSIKEPKLLSPKRGHRSLFNKVIKQIASDRVVLFMDYDGTLVSIEDRPEEANLSDSSRRVLKSLFRCPGLYPVVVSGRPRAFLRNQLGDIGFPYASDHGAQFYDPMSDKGLTLVRGDTHSWMGAVELVMKDYCRRVPESFIEKKRYGITWHYRLSPTMFGEFQARKLRRDLDCMLANFPAHTQLGKKVVEAKAIEANKSVFCRWFFDEHLEHQKLEDTILIAIGDDEADEDMIGFVESRGGIGIKVGSGPTKASYRIKEQKEVLLFLRSLSAAVRAERPQKVRAGATKRQKLTGAWYK